MNKPSALIRDLMVKTGRIFGTDIYLIDNRYLVEANESSESTIGKFMCVLNEELVKEFDKLFERKDIIYIMIKEAKDDTDAGMRLANPTQIKNPKDMKEEILSYEKKAKEWNQIKLTDESKINFFDKGFTVDLFELEKDFPTFMVGKAMIPMITEKNSDEFTYCYFKPKYDGGLNTVLFSFIHPLYQFYAEYEYFSM